MNYQPQYSQPMPQYYQPYPQYPQNYAPSGYYGPPQQPQVVYQERRSRWDDPNTCWLISILTAALGCCLGEALCDHPCCCCLIPCALPRFR